MTWRPKCQRCFEVMEPGGRRRRRLKDVGMAERAGFWWLRWGCWLCADCYDAIEQQAAAGVGP